VEGDVQSEDNIDGLNFDERFKGHYFDATCSDSGTSPPHFDLKREQSKTLTVLKLAKVAANNDENKVSAASSGVEGQGVALNEHDIKNIEEICGGIGVETESKAEGEEEIKGDEK
jgi:hypothetical protein